MPSPDSGIGSAERRTSELPDFSDSSKSVNDLFVLVPILSFLKSFDLGGSGKLGWAQPDLIASSTGAVRY